MIVRIPSAGHLSHALRAFLAPIISRRRVRPERIDGPRPYPWEHAYPAGIAWDVGIEPRPLTDLLDDAVATYPGHTCVSFRGKRFRYREIGVLVERAARGFRALGVNKGIKVALMMPNCPYSVICYYGVLKAGGTVVNINPLYASREIAHLVDDSGAVILVTLNVEQLYSKVEPLLGADCRLEKVVVCNMASVLPLREKALFTFLKRKAIAAIPKDDRHVPYERLVENGTPFEPAEIDPATDVAVLQYTGGTTGLPKGARLTHANLYANATQLAMWAPDARRGKERILGVLPLTHSFGMTAVMNFGLMVGARLELLPHFKVAELLKVIDRQKSTIVIGVPTLFSAINGAGNVDKFNLSSLRYCISGGAPLPAPVQDRFEEITGCPLVEGYGLSETAPVCTVNPLSSGAKQGSIGPPLPGTIIEITSLDDPDKLLPTGERGEICVTGPQVMLGYANRAQENAEAFRGGRLHTGDVGYLDEDGFVYIVDRIKEIILTGGFNVYPRMVEEAIYLHPAIEEAAVCGMADDHRGETVMAFIKLRDGEELSGGALRAFLRDKLAPFEIPRRIEFRNHLPKTLIGKISKKDLLAERLGNGAGAPGGPLTNGSGQS